MGSFFSSTNHEYKKVNVSDEMVIILPTYEQMKTLFGKTVPLYAQNKSPDIALSILERICQDYGLSIPQRVPYTNERYCLGHFCVDSYHYSLGASKTNPVNVYIPIFWHREPDGQFRAEARIPTEYVQFQVQQHPEESDRLTTENGFTKIRT